MAVTPDYPVVGKKRGIAPTVSPRLLGGVGKSLGDWVSDRRRSLAECVATRLHAHDDNMIRSFVPLLGRV